MAEQRDEGTQQHERSQQKTEMIADEDPLLISQSLTYVTDDGGILHSFRSATLSTGAFYFCVRKQASLTIDRLPDPNIRY